MGVARHVLRPGFAVGWIAANTAGYALAFAVWEGYQPAHLAGAEWHLEGKSDARPLRRHAGRGRQSRTGAHTASSRDPSRHCGSQLPPSASRSDSSWLPGLLWS